MKFNPRHPAPSRSYLMENFRVFALLVLLSVSGPVFVQPVSASESQSVPLQVAVTSMPPLILPDGKGYLDRVLAELLLRSGLELEAIALPPRRGLNDADAGVIDAAVIPFKTLLSPRTGPGFHNLLVLPEPLMPTEFSGMFTRTNMRLSSVEDVHDFRVGFLQGMRLPIDILEDHERKEAVSNPRALMEMLADDRVDVVLFSTATGQYIASEIGLQNLQVSDFTVRRHLYLHVHKHHANLIPLLDSHLAAMKQDGTMDSILAGYSIPW